MANTVLRFDQGGQRAEVALEFFGVTDVPVFLQWVEDELWDAFKAQTSQQCTLDEIIHYQGGGSTVRVVDEDGGNVGNAAPSSNTYLIAKIPTIAGRAGRFFWPGVVETSVDESGRLLSGSLTALQAAADAFITALDASAYGLYIVRPGPPEVLSEVDSLQVRTVIGTQRRRLYN